MRLKQMNQHSFQEDQQMDPTLVSKQEIAQNEQNQLTNTKTKPRMTLLRQKHLTCYTSLGNCSKVGSLSLKITLKGIKICKAELANFVTNN